MDDIYLYPIQVLYAIKKRPTMFLSKKSIISLFDFINGYNHCLNGVISKDKEEILLYHDFYHYLYRKYSLPYDVSIYEGMLRICSYNEEKAFEYFFEVLDDYLNHHHYEIPTT